MKLINLVAAIPLLLSAPAWADVYAFVGMPLTASQEIPATTSSGYGTVTALYDSATKTLSYSAVWQLHSGSSASAAHFHGPAAVGASAGVAIALPTQPTGNAGKSIGTVTLSASQETDLLAGRWYFNIHSSLAAGGELRAQLIENSTTLALPRYSNNILTLPAVLVPGLPGAGAYSAELGFTGSVFNLTSATPLR